MSKRMDWAVLTHIQTL